MCVDVQNVYPTEKNFMFRAMKHANSNFALQSNQTLIKQYNSSKAGMYEVEIKQSMH